MTNSRREWIRSWLPVLCWMGVVFGASTDGFSSAHTSRFIGPFLRWLKPDISPTAVDWVQTIVRKGGHLTEYGILAWLFWRARRRTTANLGVGWSNREAWIAIGFSCLYAVSDEFHQYFVASREASVRDVLLDTLGAAVGTGVLWLRERTKRTQ